MAQATDPDLPDPDELRAEIETLVDDYAEASARDLVSDHEMSSDRLDKFQAIAELNHKVGRLRESIQAEMVEAAMDNGWSPDQYTENE